MLLRALITATIVAHMVLRAASAGQLGERNRAQKYSQLAALCDSSSKAVSSDPEPWASLHY